MPLFDTFNDYEVRTGTFKDVVSAGIGEFSEYAAAAGKLDPS